MKIEFKQLSSNCCTEEYAISKMHHGKGFGNILLKELLKNCTTFGYSHIKLYPYKNNIPTVKVRLKNGGQIMDSFDDEKYVIVIPTE